MRKPNPFVGMAGASREEFPQKLFQNAFRPNKFNRLSRLWRPLANCKHHASTGTPRSMLPARCSCLLRTGFQTLFPCSPMSTPTRKNMPFNGRSILLRAFIHAPKLRRKSLILGEESGVRPLARDLHRCPQASSLRAPEALASDSQSRPGLGDHLFRARNLHDNGKH